VEVTDEPDPGNAGGGRKMGFVESTTLRRVVFYFLTTGGRPLTADSYFMGGLWSAVIKIKYELG
jgi:hypothetical protein